MIRKIVIDPTNTKAIAFFKRLSELSQESYKRNIARLEEIIKTKAWSYNGIMPASEAGDEGSIP